MRTLAALLLTSIPLAGVAQECPPTDREEARRSRGGGTRT